MSPNLTTSFWERMGLPDEAREICIRAIESLYPDSHVEEFGDQGYCSFTLSIHPSKACSTPPGHESGYIVQLRPKQHSIDLSIANAARSTFGKLAPATRQLPCTLPGDLVAVEMQRLPGVPLSQISIQHGTREQQTTLIRTFAKAIAMAWSPSTDHPSDRPTRADTPTDLHWIDEHCPGRVGRVLLPKLRRLATHLPTSSLRGRAKGVLARLMRIERFFPVVLNHGDLIPSNVLVEPESWAVTGLVDWAEAERLPFGTCLYGVEYLLGGLVREESGGLVWMYGEEAEALRGVFWEAMIGECPGLEARREEVECMRDVGVLLWYGYAWDEGRIDRVVNEVDDAAEVACLRAFLDVE